MREETLRKIALGISCLGLMLLFFYVNELSLEPVEAIDTIPTGDIVKINGIVQKIQERENVIFMTVEGQRTEKTEVVVFIDEHIPIQKGDFVEIQGLTEEYKGTKEIIAHSVQVK